MGGAGGGGSLHPSEHRLLLGVNAPPQAQAAIGAHCNPLSTGCVTPPFTEGSRLEGKAETLAHPRHCQAALCQSACTAPRSLLANPQWRGQHQT